MKEIQVTWSVENNTVVFFVPIKDWNDHNELISLLHMFTSDEYKIETADLRALLGQIKKLTPAD